MNQNRDAKDMPARRRRLGRDEMNLAEFPLATLTARNAVLRSRRDTVDLPGRRFEELSGIECHSQGSV